MGEARLAERYQPLEVVGRGGEATVLKAVDTRHDRLVALKVRVVPADGSVDDLLAETRALLSLPPHPGLAHARDDFFDGDRHVLVLDWVDGVNLARLLADEGRPGLPVSSVLRWVAQAAEALTVLHQPRCGPRRCQAGEPDRGPQRPHRCGRPGLVVGAADGDSARRHVRVPGTRGRRRCAGGPGQRRVQPGGDGVRPADRDGADRCAAGVGGDAGRRRGTVRVGAAWRAWRSIRPAVRRHRASWSSGCAPDGTTRPRPGSGRCCSPTSSSRRSCGSSRRSVCRRCWRRCSWRSIEASKHTVAGGSARRSRATPRCPCSPNALDAVHAAIGLQRTLTGRSGALRVRAGLATGELVPVDSDVLGPTVNRAARVRDLARAGEILLSASTADVARLALPAGVELIALGPHVLRGLEGTDEIAAVVTEGVSAPPDPARSPYPGLASFGSDDADLFFGREEVVERCLELFATERFVAVVGASGSGKSSRGPGRDRTTAAPRWWSCDQGSTPSKHSSGRASPATSRRSSSSTNSRSWSRSATTRWSGRPSWTPSVAHPGGLVVAVRADLYGEFGAFAELADRLASSQVLLGPLAEADLVRAVQEPARRCGLVVEEGLAEVIAAELGDAPGALPLLGHALREAWLRREGRTITLAGYRASGGVRSAIATTAEQALAALDQEGQAVARRVLLRMVELRPEGDDTRRWASRREITDVDPQRTDDVVAALTESRLLVVDHDQITVAHEALLRAWPRLNGWIVEERADLLAHQELRWATERWATGGRSDADLYRGLRLDSALDLAAGETASHGQETRIRRSGTTTPRP